MIAWFAKHPTAANLFMAAIMLLGLVALPGLQRETFPEIKNDKVQVNVIYKGATTDEVEDAICRRLEDAIDSITDLDEILCEASEGVGVATAVMREGADMAGFLDDVKSEVDAINDFPEQAENPVVKELGRTDAVVSIAITGPEDPVALKAYAEDVRTRLRALKDVSSVEISGFSEHQIRIEIPAIRLREFGLSATDIANSVQSRSVGRPAGRLEGGSEDILLRFDDQSKSVEEFQNIVVISGSTGASIKLGDIATITDRFDRDEDKIIFNGKRAAILNIAKTKAQDILDVFNTVSDFVAKENAQISQGITLALTQDRSSVVKDRLNMLVRNGIQGLLLVFLVLWLFFSFRYSFWVTMGLPVSFLGGLFLMPLLGVTINMISMVGLLIGIGLLMDDAIVIAENIAARLAKGDKSIHAAIVGVKQVLPGILSSFATTLLVFGSLSFIDGVMGQILRVLPIVLIVVLSVSLIEAFLILPSHLGHSLRHIDNRKPSRFRAGFERYFEILKEKYFGPWLDRAVDQRYLTLGLVLMLLIIAISMPAGGKLKFVGFPDIDGDIVEARLLLPQGTPLARTEAVVKQIDAALQRVNTRFKSRQPDQQDLVRNTTIVYAENPDAYESGPHVARIIADLLSAEVRDATIDEFRDAWREEVGSLTDVIAIKYTEVAVGPGGRQIDVRLLGFDLQGLKQASSQLQTWFNGYAGVIDISDDLRPGKREYQLHLKESAGVMGISASNLAAQVHASFQGIKIDEFPVGAETYTVDLRLVADDRASQDDIENMTVVSPKGALIPISLVAEIEETRGWARINRVDGRRAVTVQGDVQSAVANAREILAMAGQDIFPKLRKEYPEIQIDIQGQTDESAHTGKSIVRNVLLGLIGVYILLALQFRGYLAPLTVMVVIPTSFIGVVFGHMALGLDLTMPSIVGMASLFGVVVNDSILLVIFIREARRAGVAVPTAAKQAGRARFRAIVLTSITTIAGLTPLLLERSMQAQILIPLAASLAFGLLAATLFALYLVPAIYCILDDFNAIGELDEESDENGAASADTPSP